MLPICAASSLEAVTPNFHCMSTSSFIITVCFTAAFDMPPLDFLHALPIDTDLSAARPTFCNSAATLVCDKLLRTHSRKNFSAAPKRTFSFGRLRMPCSAANASTAPLISNVSGRERNVMTFVTNPCSCSGLSPSNAASSFTTSSGSVSPDMTI